MAHRALAVGAASSLLLLVTACGEVDPSTPTPEDLREIDLSPDHTITVDERGFRPAELVVTSGDVVLLVNEGEGQHSFTAQERFDTGLMQPGDETTLVLTEPGEIPYEDLESDAEGVLVVEEADD